MTEENNYSEWLNNITDGAQLWRLFEDMPDHLFFIKDTKACIRHCNHAMLDHLGLETKDQLLGRSDSDFLPHYMVEKYRIDDAIVIETGEPLRDIIELFPAKNGLPQLFVTNKYPVFDKENQVYGICGFIRKINDYNHSKTDYSVLEPAIDYITKNFMNKISVEELATCSKLSVRQFQRRFKRGFNQTSKEYITKFRLLRASEQLKNSNDSIESIAMSNGFYDHSTFVKSFKKYMNQAPLNYRTKHSNSRKVKNRR